MLWKYESKTATPHEVAARFAGEHFAEPRTVDEPTLHGGMNSFGYTAAFKLVDGVRTYRLECDREGRWGVSLDEVYPELIGYKCRGEKCPPPTFPDACPTCGAAKVDHVDPGHPLSLEKVRYACGGAYEPKPQIQNHTDKWWGKCPATI
jgi:hypothetical protein